MRDDNWDDLRVVLAIARAGSFAEAARRLQVNESTIARRLAQAERRLSARLFERSSGKLSATDAGNALIRRAEAIELQVQGAHTEIAGTDGRAAGSVRITAVPILANHVLAPALAALIAQHPELRIELIAEPRDLSLTRREADIAVRLARPQKEVRALARRIAILDYALYAAVGADAAALPYLAYEDRMRDLPQSRWLLAEIARTGAGQPPVGVNDAETLMHCVKAGLGKSLLARIVADREPDLVRLASHPPAPAREVWLMVHPDLRDLARIRAVTAWITQTFAGFQSA